MTLITTKFGAESTADQVLKGMDLTGKRIIVTGGSSGLGVETARALAAINAEVTLAVRNVAAGEIVAAQIKESIGNSNIFVEKLDLIDLESVRKFAESWQGKLDILINNAGIMANPFELTKAGYEIQFATNHLGHFALALALRENLKQANGARIVALSSSGHLASPVVFEDIHFKNREYEPWSAYGQSKTANILFAVEATRRWSNDGIIANALMPGGIMTNLQKHVSQKTLEKWGELEKAGKFKMKTVAQGTATTMCAALLPEFSAGGYYLEDCNQAATIANDIKASRGVREWAMDPDNAKKLWDLSLQMIN